MGIFDGYDFSKGRTLISASAPPPWILSPDMGYVRPQIMVIVSTLSKEDELMLINPTSQSKLSHTF